MGDTKPMELYEPVPDIFMLRIPIPTPLRSVNCYLARGRDGWTIIDTGFHTEETEAAWAEAFRSLDLRPADVRRIVVTHHHGDHYGAAGWLQQWTGAPVLIHDRELPRLDRIWTAEYRSRLSGFMRGHGMPDAIVAQLEAEGERVRQRVLPRATPTPVKEGERIPIGDREFEVVWAPGHADGLMVLWNAAERILIANDMILGRITPNISCWPDACANPLGMYLSSLRKVERFPARITLTGHREPVFDLQGRCRELREHHKHRLAETRRLTAQYETAWEVAQDLFREAMRSVANMRFALTETVAHLEYLHHQGELVRSETADGWVRYRPASSG